MSTALTQTTLTASINQNATVISVASATGISAPVNNVRQTLYLVNPGQTKGEAMDVLAVSGTQITVSRTTTGFFRQSFFGSATAALAAIVIIGPVPTSGLYSGGEIIGSGFQETDPVGNPNVTGTYPGSPVYTPWLNTTNGLQWIQDVNGNWQPGWNNPGVVSGPTATIASVAGTITPGSRLFHISGTNAITGFVRPVGFAGGSFKVIPDGVFTWTTGDGSIALAGTAVVNKTLEFTYDTNAGVWTPSYIA